MAAAHRARRGARHARRLIVAGILIAVTLAYLGPVRGYLDQRSELHSAQASLHDMEATRDRIKRQLAALDQPAVLEARARELDLVRPGERAYVLQGLPSSAPRPVPKRHDRSLWDRLLGLF